MLHYMSHQDCTPTGGGDPWKPMLWNYSFWHMKHETSPTFVKCSFCTCLLCPAHLVVVFGISKTHVADRESAECPLLNNLCNINTRDIYFFFKFAFIGHYKYWHRWIFKYLLITSACWYVSRALMPIVWNDGFNRRKKRIKTSECWKTEGETHLHWSGGQIRSTHYHYTLLLLLS